MGCCDCYLVVAIGMGAPSIQQWRPAKLWHLGCYKPPRRGHRHGRIHQTCGNRAAAKYLVVAIGMGAPSIQQWRPSAMAIGRGRTNQIVAHKLLRVLLRRGNRHVRTINPAVAGHPTCGAWTAATFLAVAIGRGALPIQRVAPGLMQTSSPWPSAWAHHQSSSGAPSNLWHMGCRECCFDVAIGSGAPSNLWQIGCGGCCFDVALASGAPSEVWQMGCCDCCFAVAIGSGAPSTCHPSLGTRTSSSTRISLKSSMSNLGIRTCNRTTGAILLWISQLRAAINCRPSGHAHLVEIVVAHSAHTDLQGAPLGRYCSGFPAWGCDSQPSFPARAPRPFRRCPICAHGPAGRTTHEPPTPTTRGSRGQYPGSPGALLAILVVHIDGCRELGWRTAVLVRDGVDEVDFRELISSVFWCLCCKVWRATQNAN